MEHVYMLSLLPTLPIGSMIDWIPWMLLFSSLVAVIRALIDKRNTVSMELSINGTEGIRLKINSFQEQLSDKTAAHTEKSAT